MTWNAQRGKTVLTGEEAEVFRFALEDITDTIRYSQSDDESIVDGGPSIYNHMSRTQQAASLEAVVMALYRPTEDMFPLTAWSESTLAAILATINVKLHCEIDDGESNWIRIVLNEKTDWKMDAKADEWNSIEEWSYVFDAYEEQFLWDLDYENDDVIDLSPESSRVVGSILGVDQEYHIAIPPDLANDEELQACLNRIQAIIVEPE